MVHVTLQKDQLHHNSLYKFGSALTIIPACFANNEKLCVDPVGEKADR